MISWEHIDSAPTPGGGEALRLMRRGRDYTIFLGRDELMSSRLTGSEEALAALTLQATKPGRRRSILIGGLGMGFTLRAALALCGPDDQIVVAELVPAVVRWARGPIAGIHAGSLDDPRVSVHVGDVGQLIRKSPRTFDAILLDVDNGPQGMVHKDNDLIYGGSGLAAARAALRQGGVLSVWSAGPDEAFRTRLGRQGFSVEEHRVHASRSRRGSKHVIWLARVAG